MERHGDRVSVGGVHGEVQLAVPRQPPQPRLGGGGGGGGGTVRRRGEASEERGAV